MQRVPLRVFDQLRPAGESSRAWRYGRAGVCLVCLVWMSGMARLFGGENAMETDSVLREVGRWSATGRFREAEAFLADALRRPEGWRGPEVRALEGERERLRRIRRDYPLSRLQVLRALNEGVRGFSEAELDGWVVEGMVDRRILDGEERYFVSSVANLFFRRPALEERRIPRRDTSEQQRGYLVEARRLQAAARSAESPWFLPTRIRVRMTVTVSAEAARPGSRVSAWLPIPRRYPHQDGFRLVRSRPELSSASDVAAEDSPMRSVYLGQRAGPEGGAVFEVEYEYTSRAVRFRLEPGAASGATSGSGSGSGGAIVSGSGEGGDASEWARYLKEGPHLEFTPAMRELAARLSEGSRDPLVRARRYYQWISSHVRYSYAPEYSTVGNLGEVCRADGRGECGQAAFLFMTLCRLSGIPARWQSGWSLHRGDETIHDWCEIRLEPWGWVPVDPYMGMYAMQYTPGLEPDQRLELRDFYFGGLNPHRMAANSDHGQVLQPAKESIRSDPVDFQRGEVEVDGRNVYFDGFEYRLSWEELPGP